MIAARRFSSNDVALVINQATRIGPSFLIADWTYLCISEETKKKSSLKQEKITLVVGEVGLVRCDREFHLTC